MEDFRNTRSCKQYISPRTIHGWEDCFETFEEFLEVEVVPFGEITLVRDDHKQQWLFVPHGYWESLKFVECPHCGNSHAEDSFCNCPTVMGDGWENF